MNKPMKSRELAVAYNVKKKASGGRVGCMDCMSMGGKCMAHGGAVDNEELDPSHEDAMAPGMKEDMDAMDMEDNQSSRAKFASGGVVDEIMESRRGKKSGGDLTDVDVEPDFEKRIDMEPVHTRRDEMHDTESGSLDDESLVGQILKERKLRRRG